MTDTAEKTVEKTLEEQFKDGLDPAGAVKMAERIDALEERNKILTKERDDAIAAGKAKPKTVTAKAAAPKPRKLGVLADDKKLDRDALRALVAASEDVEVAFVDTKGLEIRGSKPFAFSGNPWKDHSLGMMQSEPIEIVGEGPAYEIGGYALIVDGKHVATSMRSEPINVVPGARIKLVDDVVF